MSLECLSMVTESGGICASDCALEMGEALWAGWRGAPKKNIYLHLIFSQDCQVKCRVGCAVNLGFQLNSK